MSYFPFGAIYAPFSRGLTAPIEEWEKDLRLMKKLGFTFTYGFAEWHDIERKKGEYDFTTLDYVVEMCKKIGLNMAIHIAIHCGYGFYPPRWLMLEYNGEGIINSNRVEVEPRGLYTIPCIDDPKYRSYAEKFIEAVAEHYKESSVVQQWTAWAEPTLSETGEITCYCKFTIDRFQNWLKDKYKTIQKLNVAWGTEGPSDFVSWKEIQPPTGCARHQGSYAAWLDWRDFADSNLMQAIKWVSSIIKKVDKKRPTLVETCGVTSNTTAMGVDTWKMAKAIDVLGTGIWGTGGPCVDAMLGDVFRSVAQIENKSFQVIEATGGPKIFRERPGLPSPEEMTLTAWQAIAHGAKGFTYWCFRPRLSDVEGGEFGLIGRDGSLRDRAVATGKVSQILQKHREVFFNGKIESKIAIFYSQFIEHLTYGKGIDGKNEKNYYTNSLRGAYQLLWEENIPVDFLNPEWICKDALKRYKVLILPFSYLLSKNTASAIKDFVQDGGTLIADFACAMKNEQGICYYHTPGAGLTEVFGAEEVDVAPVRDEDFIQFSERLRSSPKQNMLKIRPDIFKEVLKSVGGEIIARFTTGEPAIIVNKYGKGEAIFAGTMLFHSYYSCRDMAIRKFLIGFLNERGITSLVEVNGISEELRLNIEVVVMKSQNKKVAVIMNHNLQPIKANLKIKEIVKSGYDLIKNENISVKKQGDCSIFPIELNGKETKVFLITLRN